MWRAKDKVIQTLSLCWIAGVHNILLQLQFSFIPAQLSELLRITLDGLIVDRDELVVVEGQTEI